MHCVAWIQPSLDLSKGISTVPMRKPSEKKDNKGGKMRAKREEGGNGEVGSSKKSDTEVLGFVNVVTECSSQSKSMSTLVSRVW